MMGMTKITPSPQNNPTWTKTSTTPQTKGLWHEQPAIPTWKMPADTFYTPWGNLIQPVKQPQTIRLALQNFGGWPQWNNHYKNQAI